MAQFRWATGKVGLAGLGQPALRDCAPYLIRGTELPLAQRAAAGHNVPVSLRDKIVSRERLRSWRDSVAASGRMVVVTNGCFDLLHAGHVTYLEEARRLGDLLLVGLNSDSSIRQFKGADRPVNSEQDRATVLAALESVDAVCVFGEPSAEAFLEEVRPDVYVKGGDYTLETLNQRERRTVESLGGRIHIIPMVPGKSTTALLKKIAGL